DHGRRRDEQALSPPIDAIERARQRSTRLRVRGGLERALRPPRDASLGWVGVSEGRTFRERRGRRRHGRGRTRGRGLKLTYATRRSALALAQSRAFVRALVAANAGLETVELQLVTSGD